MSKTPKVGRANIEKAVMAKIKSDQVSMKPRWYFVLGSSLMFVGLVGFTIGAAFLLNLTLFLLRKHGPGGQWRLQLILESFPWWIPVLAVIGIVLGIWLLKKHDFSYKKNFLMIVAGFIISIVLAAFILDYSGLNDIWSQRGPMRRFYQRFEKQDEGFPKGPGQGWGQNDRGNRNFWQGQ